MGFAGSLIKLAILMLIAAIVIQVTLLMGWTKKIYNHQPGPCKLVHPIVDGSEDIELLPNGLAVVTSGLRYIPVPELKNVVGKLYLYDFNGDNANPKATELKITPGKLDIKSFNPHGISSHIDEKGSITLYIVNHGANGHTIEVFRLDVQKVAVTHVKTLKSELLYNPNDLIVIGPEQFYVSNNRFFDNTILQTIESILPQVKLCSIVFYDKGQFSIADNFLRLPNGLTVDPTKKFLYAACADSIVIYKINSDKSLTMLKTIEMNTHCDNLFFDAETNSLWSGCHPIAHEIVGHIYNPKTKTAPTQVLRISFNGKDHSYSISDVYSNNGKQISAGTIGVRYKDHFLIGTVCDKLMLCNIAHSDTV